MAADAGFIKVSYLFLLEQVCSTLYWGLNQFFKICWPNRSQRTVLTEKQEPKQEIWKESVYKAWEPLGLWVQREEKQQGLKTCHFFSSVSWMGTFLFNSRCLRQWHSWLTSQNCQVRIIWCPLGPTSPSTPWSSWAGGKQPKYRLENKTTWPPTLL